MAYRLLAYMDGVEYNRKLFQIDGGEEDLPPIRNKADITPGSEAHSLKVTSGRWKLSTEYEWIFVPWPGGYVDPANGAIADVPRNPANTCYVRVCDEMGVRSWEPLQIGSLQEVNVSMALIGQYKDEERNLFLVAKGGVMDMVRARVVFVEGNKVVDVKGFDRQDGMYRCLIPQNADWYYVTINKVPRIGETNPDLTSAVLCVASIDHYGGEIPVMTQEQWAIMTKKPPQAFITDSVFDMKTRLF